MRVKRAAGEGMSGFFQHYLRWVLLLVVGLSACVESQPQPQGSAPTTAQEPPQNPILRLETEMHSARISRIALDAENRYLATASDDKTIRIWELPGGRLLRVIRPPIGQGNEGKIYAVALSPDGHTVACAGWTGLEWDGTHSIYLFDRASGRMLRRITGLPHSVPTLAYSPDGRVLVAGLHGKDGIRIYRATDNVLIAEDRNYGAETYGAAFDLKGRLVTSSWDGFVRLYDHDFRLLTKVQPSGGHHPYGIAFTSDGSRIAVGFDDTTTVDVLSGDDLRHMYSPDTDDVKKGSMSSVAWSADGELLYGGGLYNVNGAHPVRKWTKAGRGPWTDLQAADNTIMHILPLRNSGIAYGASDPAFGLFDARDHRTLYRGSTVFDYRDTQIAFLLSHDGSKVQVGVGKGATSLRFSVPDRLLELNPSRATDLLPPRTSASGLSITGWKNGNAPLLNGRKLKLDDYELCRSIAIAPDEQTIVLGTVWHLRLFDRQGRQLWQIPLPSNIWSVNIAGNGQLVVGALGDGTIRWYRMADGQEILALFPHPDRKRWVLWTPSGYYDAGPGGEGLLGWHKNYNKDTAGDFFPTAKFHSVSYRPALVSKILEALDEADALRVSKTTPVETLQPIVTIISPQDGSLVSTQTITVRYQIQNPSQEPGINVAAFLDGQAVPVVRGVIIKKRQRDENSELRELQVQIPPRNCEIKILVSSSFGKSNSATVRLKWRGASETFTIKPALYALIIGPSGQGDHEAGAASGPDAVDFAAALKRQEGQFYRTVSVKALTNTEATKDNILDGLDWLDRETTSQDTAIMFLSGPGVTDKNGINYFLPVNAKVSELRRTALAISDLKNTVGALAGKTVIFTDTCRSRLEPGLGSCSAWINALVPETGSGDGIVVFSSAGATPDAKQGAGHSDTFFAQALTEAFDGKAAVGASSTITMNMLDIYLTDRMKVLTKGQRAVLTVKPYDVADFALASVPQAPLDPSPRTVRPTPPTPQENEILRRLPPVVTILSPEDGARISRNPVTVRYVVRAPSKEPVTEISGLVDGRPGPGARNLPITDQRGEREVRELQVQIPERDSVISILAKNRWASSEPAAVRVRWHNSDPASEAVAKPTLYAFIVGVSRYEDPALELQFPAKDAKDFAEALRRQRGGLYREVVTRILTDADATKDHILEGLDWINREPTSKDLALIFLAGHGVNDKSGIYYFLPTNAKTDQMRRTGLPFSDIKNAVASISAKALLFADTCHSGNILGRRRGLVDINRLVNELTNAENGVVVFASSTGKQDALEDPAWGNGAFTKALVEGLNGKAMYGASKVITVNMLDLYVSERVKALTKGQQTPTTTKPQTIQDFPIALEPT